MGTVKALVFMGVSGCGKSTVGCLAAGRLGWAFFDADDFHPPENVAKMSRGIPLTDEDRAGWLARLAALIREHLEEGQGVVLACSALKERYRAVLRGSSQDVVFVHLSGSYELILARMRTRQGHYMKDSMLRSQFESLEAPDDSLVLDIRQTPEFLAEQVWDYMASNLEVAEWQRSS